MSGTDNYTETFISWPIIGVVVFANLLVFLAFHFSLSAVMFLFFSGFLLLNFFAFTLEIDGNTFIYQFGLGLLAYSIPINTIEKCEILDNNSLFSWAYNPRGEQSLAILIRNNRLFRFPSVETRKIIGLLQSKI